MRKSYLYLSMSGLIISALLVFNFSSGSLSVKGQASLEDDRERALECSAALAGVALAFKQNEPEKLPPIMEDLNIWIDKLGKKRQHEIVPHFKKMDAQHGSRWSIETALSCRSELHNATPTQCLKIVKERQDQAIWYFKAAGNQALFGRAIGGHIAYAHDNIRTGCKHLDYARAKIRQMNCNQEIIDVLDETWRNYVLDVPGPNGNVRIACLGNEH